MLNVISDVLAKVAESTDPTNSETVMLLMAEVECPKELIK